MEHKIEAEAERLGIPYADLLEKILWLGWECYVDDAMEDEA